MKNLVDELGLEYVDQFYRGALFQLDNKIYQYQKHSERGVIQCRAFAAESKSPRWQTVYLASEKILNMDVFGWPKLGYREFTDAYGQKFVYFVSVSRSAMRGLREELIQFTPAPVVRLIPKRHELRQWCNTAVFAQGIFLPTFTDFDTGMELLRTGKCCSFALNEDIAVCLSTNRDHDREFDILYKESVIGEVLADNTVVIPHKIAKRASSMALFNGKVVF
jgi:hypothetical protein